MNLTSFINPGIAVDMIKKQIKKQLNKEIENFEIFYLAEKDKMYLLGQYKYFTMCDKCKQQSKDKSKDMNDNNTNIE